MTELSDLRNFITARTLAVALWRKHYQTEAPLWQPADDLAGVLSQIDNMTAGLTKPRRPMPIWERQQEIRNILYRRLPVEIDGNDCRSIADEIFRTMMGERPMNAETSDRVAGLAAVLVHLGEDDILQAAAPGNSAKLADLASDIRSVAASALRQREDEMEITGSPAEQVDISRVAATNAIHPAPIEFTTAQLVCDPILRYFHYAHLPMALRGTSMAFCALAASIIESIPRNAERTVALRKLLEAKDAAVRANIPDAGTVLTRDPLARSNQETYGAAIDSLASEGKVHAPGSEEFSTRMHALGDRLESGRPAPGFEDLQDAAPGDERKPQPGVDDIPEISGDELRSR
jgi:hypothetical protein